MENFTPEARGFPGGKTTTLAIHFSKRYTSVEKNIFAMNTTIEYIVNCSKKLLVAVFCQSVGHKTVHFLLQYERKKQKHLQTEPGGQSSIPRVKIPGLAVQAQGSGLQGWFP